jgi:hypothetical protein
LTSFHHHNWYRKDRAIQEADGVDRAAVACEQIYKQTENYTVPHGSFTAVEDPKSW